MDFWMNPAPEPRMQGKYPYEEHICHMKDDLDHPLLEVPARSLKWRGSNVGKYKCLTTRMIGMLVWYAFLGLENRSVEHYNAPLDLMDSHSFTEDEWNEMMVGTFFYTKWLWDRPRRGVGGEYTIPAPLGIE